MSISAYRLYKHHWPHKGTFLTNQHVTEPPSTPGCSLILSCLCKGLKYLIDSSISQHVHSSQRWPLENPRFVECLERCICTRVLNFNVWKMKMKVHGSWTTRSDACIIITWTTKSIAQWFAIAAGEKRTSTRWSPDIKSGHWSIIQRLSAMEAKQNRSPLETIDF